MLVESEKKQLHSGITQGLERVHVRVVATARIQIDLEIARMYDGSGRGFYAQPEALNNRMADSDEGTGEVAEFHPLPCLYRMEGGIFVQSVFTKPVFCQGQCKNPNRTTAYPDDS